MTDLATFAIGAFIGIAFFYLCILLREKKLTKKWLIEFSRNEKEDKEFILNLPSKGTPGTIKIGNNSAIYDDSGDLVWDSVRGCVGKACALPPE